MSQKQKNYRVIFGDDYISIETTKGDEVIYWDKAEWEEEPDVVFSICNAVKLASENDPSLLDFLQKNI
jgi:hypothetical protein